MRQLCGCDIFAELGTGFEDEEGDQGERDWMN